MIARTLFTAPIFGTVASIRGVPRVGTDPAACDFRVRDACFESIAELHRIDRLFSPFREDSEISAIRRGELVVGQAAADVQEVARLCVTYEQITDERFSASWRGAFDPTGLVKGWSVQRVADRFLRDLLDADLAAVAIGVGGDTVLLTADDADWTWGVGIVDPKDRMRVPATVRVRSGAVATSGTAERGEHIVDPRTGTPVTGVRSATVIAPNLTDADVWATAAIVAGVDLGWISAAPQTSGILLSSDAPPRRWSSGVELTSASMPFLAGPGC